MVEIGEDYEFTIDCKTVVFFALVRRTRLAHEDPRFRRFAPCLASYADFLWARPKKVCVGGYALPDQRFNKKKPDCFAV